MKVRRLFVVLLPAAAVVAVLAGSTYGEERTWTDRTGKHKVEAEFVLFKDGEVSLRKSDGKVVKFSIEKLSKSDQAFVREIEEKQAIAAKSGWILSNLCMIRQLWQRFS